MESRRIVVTMGASGQHDGFFLPHTRGEDQVEVAEDLGEALRSCIERPCDRLYVSLFAARPSELTCLSLFRAMRPSQYVVLVVDAAIRPLVEGLGLGDECMTFES